MISEQHLAQLRALIETALQEQDKRLMGLIEQMMDRRNLRRSADKTAAERMRRYRKKQALRVTGKRNGSEGKSVTVTSFELPEWLVPHRDVWDAWVEARTRAKHPPTAWAKSLAVSKLERLVAEGHNVRRLLADAAFHNWQSFYVTKD